MKSIVVPLLLVGLLQNAAFSAAPSKSRYRAPVRRRAVKPPPPVDPTEGDNVDGDDLTVRRAAVAALGTTRGSVVVVDPSTGRVLTMVNQRLGLKSGFTPCSTIKLVTSLAALTEHVVERGTSIRLSRYASFDLTTAIAHSNNPYFATLGNRLGFERVTYYAHMLGLGEKAGLDIPGEQPGTVPAEPPRYGGVGMMTSFGTGFLMTPLELAALLSSIANGGTLYYLQYPRTEADIDQFRPRVKRNLELAPTGIADIRVGMRGAVDFGTARRAGYDPSEPILGKTGTCTDFNSSSHMGWFGSFNDVGKHQLVVVVMLAAINKSVSGPVAAGVAGAIYRNLSEQRYFAMDARTKAKSDLPEILSTSPCCGR
ncbi:MAG: penicillin-binding protein [Acidobacteriia bacterium]|nr:penicillin-binding protein [Terriglobia bacterium]